MSDRIQAIRGMNDILPTQTFLWRRLEQTLINCLAQYGYQEIRFPFLESTHLFKRTIGEVTDIVEKEMYVFTDLNGESIALRPEGTAGCVRACIEHGLLHNQQQKLWYTGPMFRHEKPQKGRYRQFHQLGVEALGISGTAIEIELIALCRRFWRALGIESDIYLEINTLGEPQERQAYREILVEYLEAHYDALDEDSRRRLTKNPLRILDSKAESMQTIIQKAPKLIDVVSETSRQHFLSVCEGLKALGIHYTVNPFLVRGLDYYGHTVFEWVTNKLGSQGTICAGGRYNGLVEQLGGGSIPAVGFALGMERLLLLLQTIHKEVFETDKPFVYFIAVGEPALQQALFLAEKLRNEIETIVLVNTSGGSFKSQFKKADKSEARLALILGDEEVTRQHISVKDLRVESEQQTIAQSQLTTYLKSYLQ